MIKRVTLMVLVLCLLTGCTVSTTPSVTEAQAPIKIGFISDIIIDDNAFLTQAVNEFATLCETLNFEGIYQPVEDTYEWMEKTKALCESGCALVIAIGWQSGVAFPLLAELYPDISFVMIDTDNDDDQIKGVTFDVLDGAYVLGAMLATAFPDETIFGYIGNYNDDFNYEYQYGFTQGVISVNPKARFDIAFANTYSDVDTTYELAMEMAQNGVHIIMGSVSSSANEGIYQAALEVALDGGYLYTTGLSVDQTTAENPYIIGGLTKQTDLAIRQIVTQFLAGTLTKTDEEMGSGAFGVIHVSVENANYRNVDIITDEIVEQMKELYANLLSGEILIDFDATQYARR